MTSVTIRFGPFRLKPAERLLERDGASVPLGSRALDLLIALVERAGEVVSRRELIDRVWPDLVVEEANLRVHVASLRKVLGEGAGSARYITNLPGRGYCFVAPVEYEAEPPRPVVAPRPRPISLMPPRLARMVGRDEEVSAVAALVRERRFASIIGPGGMGKTTVAVAVAHELATDFDGRLGFVDLAALADPELVTATVSASVGAPLTEPDPLPGLLAFVADRRMLIVLDNCEHLVEAVARLAEQLYARAPALCLLTTSREALRVEGENVHILAPLPGPPDLVTEASELLKYPAGQLFMERAVASGYRETLDSAGASLVAGMCHRLDGIALAIELVASRVGAYGVKGTAELLDNRFKLLWHGRRSALPRHQTLHAMLDWSFNLLSARDRAIFARLGIFAGLFDLAAAEAVAGEAAYDDVEVEQSLDNLVEKSLVWTVSAAGPSPLYRLSHVTRDFALHQLAQHGEDRAVARRHAQHVKGLLEAGGFLDPAQDNTNVADLTPFIPNLRTALDWSFSEEGDRDLAVALAVAAAPLWLAIGRLGECRRWSKRALDRLADGDRGGPKEAALQQALATSAMFTRGNDSAVRAAIARGLELAVELGQDHRQLQLLAGQHIFLQRIGEFDQAVEVSLRSVEIAARVGSAKAQVAAEWMLGTAYHLVGRQLEALRHCDRGFAIVATNEVDVDYFGYDHRVRALIVMARTLWLQGQWDRGLGYGRSAIEEAERRGRPVSLCIALIYTATALLWNRSLDEAEAAIQRLIRLATRHSLGPYHDCGLVLQGELKGARGEYEASIEDLQSALSRLNAENHQIMNSGALRALAGSLMQMDKLPEARGVIDGAIERAERTGGKFDLAELHRIQGEIRLRSGDVDGAQAALTAAITVAEDQNAVSWRLRSGEAIARLWLSRGLADEAHAEASGLLAQLSSCGPGDLLVATRDRVLALLAEVGAIASSPRFSPGTPSR